MLVWQAWKAYAHRAGGYQTRAVLSLVYLVVLGPAALIGQRFSARLLDLTFRPGQTTWLERGPGEKTLDALRRQF